MDQETKELLWTISIIPKIPIAHSGHLLLAVVSPSATFTEQPPPDPAKDPGSSEMLLGGASLHIQPLAWQHVVRPSGRDACPLDHPLEHRQQQGDEPQKHQLCITQSQRAKVSAMNIFILSVIPEKRKGRPRFCTKAIGWVVADSQNWRRFLLFFRQIKQVLFFKMHFCNTGATHHNQTELANHPSSRVSRIHERGKNTTF
jgi:hypothetical protein